MTTIELEFTINNEIYIKEYNCDLNSGLQNLMNYDFDAIGSIFGICGCTDKDVLLLIYNVMQQFIINEHNCYATDLAIRLNADYKAIILVLLLLDSKSLIEHGTSIRGSWKTKRLELIFPLIKANFEGTINQAIISSVCENAEKAFAPVKNRTDMCIKDYDISDLLLKIIDWN